MTLASETATPTKSEEEWVHVPLTSASVRPQVWSYQIAKTTHWIRDESKDINNALAVFLISALRNSSPHEAPEPTINATKRHDLEEAVSQSIVMLFEKARDEFFEDGMESVFSRKLVSLVQEYGNAAVEAIASLTFEGKANAEVAAEGLRWLGHMDHPSSYDSRRRLLEKSLFSSSARIRDGAALGLASLDDPAAIPNLGKAIEREPHAELREDLEQVLAQLEATRQCHSS